MTGLAVTRWKESDVAEVCRNTPGLATPIVSITLGTKNRSDPNHSLSNTSSHTYFANNQSMLFELPLTINTTGSLSANTQGGVGRCEDKTELACMYWEVENRQWEGSACTFLGVSPEGKARCSCKHLTEFAVIERYKEKSGNSVSCGRNTQAVAMPFLDRIVYLAASGVFLCLMSFSLVQVFRLLVAKKICTPTGFSHLFITAHTLSRVVSSFLLSGIAAPYGYSLSTSPLWLVAVILALPYMLSSWSVSYILGQWVSIVHNTRLSRSPF